MIEFNSPSEKANELAKSPYADLPEPLKSNLPALFGSYNDLEETSPSSWIVWSKDKCQLHEAQICHAALSWSPPGFENLVTAVPNISELSLEYLRMLIRGPFRSLSDLIRLDRVGGFYYLHCLELNKWPANVLMNFCIASRVPIEFEYFLKPWAKYCDEGFEPTLAYLLTCSYGSKAGGSQHKTRTFDLHRPGHMWFDPASKWFNILNGIIEKPSKSFNQQPRDVSPTNIIWGKCNDYEKLMEMSDKDIAEFYTQSVKVHQPPEPPPVKVKKQFHIPMPLHGMPIPVLNGGGGGGLIEHNAMLQQAHNAIQQMNALDLAFAEQPAPPQPAFVGEIQFDEDDEFFEPGDDD